MIVTDKPTGVPLFVLVGYQNNDSRPLYYVKQIDGEAVLSSTFDYALKFDNRAEAETLLQSLISENILEVNYEVEEHSWMEETR